MTEIVLKPELIKNLQKVLVDYEPANQDPILAAQYLSAVVGSIVASSSMPSDQQKEILKQIRKVTAIKRQLSILLSLKYLTWIKLL